MDIDQDIEYFRHKLIRSGRSLGKTRAQLALLEDSLIIYRLVRLPREDKYQHTIPASLLVQTFMRKLRDDLDRR